MRIVHTDEDDLRPSEYAVDTAMTLVYGADDLLREPAPEASISIGEDGSVSLYWKKPGKILELNIPSQEQGTHYIYYRKGEAHGVEQNVTADTLAQWLEWYVS